MNANSASCHNVPPIYQGKCDILNAVYSSIPTGELVAGVDKGITFVITRKVSPSVFWRAILFLGFVFDKNRKFVVQTKGVKVFYARQTRKTSLLRRSF